MRDPWVSFGGNVCMHVALGRTFIESGGTYVFIVSVHERNLYHNSYSMASPVLARMIAGRCEPSVFLRHPDKHSTMSLG